MINSSVFNHFSNDDKRNSRFSILRDRAIIEKLYMAVANEIEASADRFHALTA